MTTENENTNIDNIVEDILDDLKEDGLNDNDQNDLSYFSSGNSLESDDIYNILRRGNARFIVIAGTVRSGKTTLLSAIYEKFQYGASEHFQFSGSETLLGFEKCTHMSRLASGGEQVDTPRTGMEDKYRYMHLNLTAKNNLEKTDILFSDVSGELFDLLIKNNDECEKHEIIKRADHFIYLIDGRKLLTLLERDRIIGDCISVLRRLKENNMIRECTRIHIIISKYDLIAKLDDPEKNIIDLLIQKLVDTKIRSILDLASHQVELYKLAVRINPATRSDVKDVTDVDDMLKKWIDYRPKTRGLRLKSTAVQKKSSRMIDKFSI